MLKPQDIILLLKFLANAEHLNWTQNQLALHLGLSISEVNAGFKRLRKTGLLQQVNPAHKYHVPVLDACEEFLITGLKYVFPAELGEHTRGIATSYAAPVFENKISFGQDPIPVWPHAEGNERGVSLKPLYPSVPQSIIKYPDQAFYDLLALVDAIRQGRARERNMAEEMLVKRLKNTK